VSSKYLLKEIFEHRAIFYKFDCEGIKILTVKKNSVKKHKDSQINLYFCTLEEGNVPNDGLILEEILRVFCTPFQDSGIVRSFFLSIEATVGVLN
jgi:hypothetical protein